MADQPPANHRFGPLRVPDLLDQDAVVRGRYRRNPAPVLEPRTLVPERGRTVHGFGWIGSYLLAVILALAGGHSLARPKPRQLTWMSLRAASGTAAHGGASLLSCGFKALQLESFPRRAIGARCA